MSVHLAALRARLAQAGRLARQAAIRESLKEDAEELKPYGGHKAEQARGYPGSLLFGLSEANRLLDQIDAGIRSVDLLNSEIVRDADMDPLFAKFQVLRTYRTRPEESGEIIQLVVSDRGHPKGLWQTHKKGKSIFRLELLRRSGNERLCKRVLERDRRGAEKLGASLGLPIEVVKWLGWTPKNQTAWKLEPNRIIVAG